MAHFGAPRPDHHPATLPAQVALLASQHDLCGAQPAQVVLLASQPELCGSHPAQVALLASRGELCAPSPAVDLLFFALVPLGVESLTIDPAKSGSLALTLGYMPWSHSLVAAAVWTIGLGFLTRSWEVGVVTASHWFLDLPMHLGDLPLAAGDGPRVGFGLWSAPGLALAFELAPLGAGMALYARRVGARRALALGAALMAVQAAQSLLIPLPTQAWQVAAMLPASYAGFAVAAWWAEGGRAPPGAQAS